MNADNFWKIQEKKNLNGTPKYCVSTEPDTPEQEIMEVWVDKWHEHFTYFDNEGCGCCVNLYYFDAPDEAIAELPTKLVSAHEESEESPGTGKPSSFREFNRSVPDPK